MHLVTCKLTIAVEQWSWPGALAQTLLPLQTSAHTVPKQRPTRNSASSNTYITSVQTTSLVSPDLDPPATAADRTELRDHAKTPTSPDAALPRCYLGAARPYCKPPSSRLARRTAEREDVKMQRLRSRPVNQATRSYRLTCLTGGERFDRNAGDERMTECACRCCRKSSEKSYLLIFSGTGNC